MRGLVNYQAFFYLLKGLKKTSQVKDLTRLLYPSYPEKISDIFIGHLLRQLQH